MSHTTLAADAIVQATIEKLGPKLVVGTPLGIGKPNELLNAFYARARADSSVSLEIITALSLAPPRGSSLLEKRFIEPFSSRHFGDDYPRLSYLDDLRANRLPTNVSVIEFYLQSGTLLSNTHSQSHYISTNYTHVARDMLDRGVNVVLQAVSAPRTNDGLLRYSLSLNPDVSLELCAKLKATRRSFVVAAQVLEALPYMGGHAEVDSEFFHFMADRPAAHKLFAPPREPISDVDYAIGLNASALIADGGTLQLGIGSLGDAVTYGCLLRDQHNDAYRSTLTALGTTEAAAGIIKEVGGLAPFDQGLHGCSEMMTDGFMHLLRADILKLALPADTDPPSSDAARPIMRAAFALGSHGFYDFLRNLDEETWRKIDMAGVDEINQLYGQDPAAAARLRPKARFINASMKSTALGAAISDALGDERVVSGVGGQYNFVAMAHAMADGRSILMLRSYRQSGGKFQPNIVWSYGHTTIPRHLRDIVVSEYGIADLRGKTDRECALAMISIADARTQGSLIEQAQKAGKLPSDFSAPDSWSRNTPEHIQSALAHARQHGHFPAYPFGSDFDETEQVLLRALARIKKTMRHRSGAVRAALRALRPGNKSALSQELIRMGLNAPETMRERLAQRLLIAALNAKL